MTRSRPGLSFPTLISTTHDAHDDRCYIGIGQLRHEASRNAGIEPELFAEQALHSAGRLLENFEESPTTISLGASLPTPEPALDGRDYRRSAHLNYKEPTASLNKVITECVLRPR